MKKQLVWEDVPQKDDETYAHLVRRAVVPGGWLVLVCDKITGAGTTSPKAVTFVPDPNNSWTGENWLGM